MVYVFGCWIDDVVDGELVFEIKIIEFDVIRKLFDNIDDLFDLVLVVLVDVVCWFLVLIVMFVELIDGVCMEIDWIGCCDFDELIVYCCWGVGMIGKFCFFIFGFVSMVML